jgi:hypothetical protein
MQRATGRPQPGHTLPLPVADTVPATEPTLGLSRPDIGSGHRPEAPLAQSPVHELLDRRLAPE